MRPFTHIHFTVDGTDRQAVLHTPEEQHAAALVLHPHPLYGGDMDNGVVIALCDALYDHGIASLRFDFRGVPRVRHRYEGVMGAVQDASAAFAALTRAVGCRRVGVVGYSFGGSVALCVAADIRPASVSALSASYSIASEADDLKQRLASITCPVLMYHGLRDTIVPPKDMGRFKEGLVSATVHTEFLPDEGHFYGRSLPLVTTAICKHVVEAPSQ